MSVFTDKNGDIMGDSSRASNTAMSRSGRLSRSVVSSSSSGRQESVLAGDGRFQLFTKLGAGAFGQVYHALDLITGRDVALKLERKTVSHSQLEMEYRTYKLLARRRAPGIPEVMYKGHEGPFRIIAMDLLGPSIEDLLTYCNRHLSLKTVMMISMQMVRLVEVVHRTGFIHRDIKPENFVMGMQAKANIVYMIDFGLAKQYCDPKTGSHICFKMDKGFIGTARYSSIASHLGHEQARRDDMEALCYLFAYLGNGSLPWQGVAAPDRQHRKRIIQEKKVTLPVDDIMGKLPRCYHSMLKTLKSLAFEAKPNYDLYITWLEDEFRARNFEKDFNYDWFEHAEKINSYNTNA